MKEFSKFEKARIKRVAQNVAQYVSKKNKLTEEFKKIVEEMEQLQKLIDLSDAPVKLMTGGYGVESLVKKVVTPTDKLNKQGNIITVTTYEFIYPDTIIPPTQEADPTPTMPEMGNDYDVDEEKLNENI